MSAGRRGEPEGVIDLRRLDLSSGAGARRDMPVAPGEVVLGGQAYAPDPPEVDARLDVGSSGSGIDLRLRFVVALRGPCQRCLAPATVQVAVDARDFQGAGRVGADRRDDDLDCEYLSGPALMDLDLAAWARDSMAGALPMSVLCAEGCAGLCPGCGTDLNAGRCDCVDDRADPRWAALAALRERLEDPGEGSA